MLKFIVLDQHLCLLNINCIFVSYKHLLFKCLFNLGLIILLENKVCVIYF